MHTGFDGVQIQMAALSHPLIGQNIQSLFDSAIAIQGKQSRSSRKSSHHILTYKDAHTQTVCSKDEINATERGITTTYLKSTHE